MQSLRLFCEVVRHQSFSRAAVNQGITQSAASQRIGSLEKRLGVTLLDRSVRPLAMTEAGKIFFEEVLSILDRFDQLQSRLGAFQPKLTGQVRVAAIYSAGVDLLRHIEKSFAAEYSNISIDIRYRRPQGIHDAVRAGQCDLGILSYPQRWRDVAFIPLRDEPMAVVCSPRHPLAGSGSVGAGDLGTWPMVAFEPELPVARKIKSYLRDHGVDPDIVNVFDNIDTIKSAVAGTDRISILPKRTVLREVAASVLDVVELEPELVRPMGIIHRKRSGSHNSSSRKPFTPAIQAFIDFLIEHAGPEADVVDEADAKGRQMVGGKV